MARQKPVETSSQVTRIVSSSSEKESRQLFHKPSSTLGVSTSNTISKSEGTTSNVDESYHGLTAKQILSRMVVYNAYSTNSSTSTDSSLASCTGIKPSTAILSAFQTLDLSTLSHSYGILLIIRRYVIQGGCLFCNRRMTQINEWRKSLLQLGIVPVILHSESVEDGNLFFKELCNPQLQDIWRVSDPNYQNSIQFCKSPDSGTTPLQFVEYDKYYMIKNLKKVLPALANGYFDPAHRYKVEKDLKINPSSLEVKARVLLIKNDRVVKTWDHAKHDDAPDVLSEVIIGLDWLTRELTLGIDNEDESSEDDLIINSERQALITNPNEVEISLDGEDSNFASGNEFSTSPNNGTNILRERNQDIPSPSEFVNPSNNSSPPTISITNRDTQAPPYRSEDMGEFEEPGSPISPASPTKNLTSILKTLNINIDIYKKEKRKFEFRVVSPQQQRKELKEKTLEANQKFNDLKAKISSIGSAPQESSGCFPVRLPSNRFNCGQENSLIDLGESLGSVSKLMESDRMRKYFKLFSVKEYNAESILFWEDVNLYYKKLFKSQKLSIKAKTKIIEHSHRIANRYLFEDESLLLINTTDTLKAEVARDLPKTDSNLETKEDIEKAENIFEEVLVDIMAHVLPDIFVRFVFSQEYKQMKAEHGLMD